MLATLTGDLCLLVGLAVLLLPLLATELSRPRDGAWGAVVLLLGLVLVTSSDRLRGAPMLAVACGALLIGRLGVEVAQARWNRLSSEEQQRLSSSERWSTSVQQLIAAVVSLSGNAGSVLSRIKPSLPTTGATPKREGASKSGKRWVRPEASPTEAEPAVSTAIPASEAAEETSKPSASAEASNTETAADTEEQTQPEQPAAAAEQPQPLRAKGFGAPRRQGKGKGKRWVRPEPEARPPSDQPSDTAEHQQQEPDQPSATEEPSPLPPIGTDQD